MLPWQPIETAPKDGTEILLFCTQPSKLEAGTDVEWFEVGFWGTDLYDDEGWTEGRDRADLTPTYWCPLTRPE